MARLRIEILAAACAATLMFSGAGTAAEWRMANAARPPLGFQLFCLQNPAECRGGGASSVQMSDTLMTLLNRVNTQVNRAITPRHDRGPDRWSLGVRYGDCEDYVLAKRHELMRAGVPSSALRIAFARTRDGQNHAVLIVRTNRGDYVLDNLTTAIKPIAQTGLRIISISGADPRQWSAT